MGTQKAGENQNTKRNTLLYFVAVFVLILISLPILEYYDVTELDIFGAKITREEQPDGEPSAENTDKKAVNREETSIFKPTYLTVNYLHKRYSNGTVWLEKLDGSLLPAAVVKFDDERRKLTVSLPSAKEHYKRVKIEALSGTHVCYTNPISSSTTSCLCK